MTLSYYITFLVFKRFLFIWALPHITGGEKDEVVHVSVLKVFACPRREIEGKWMKPCVCEEERGGRVSM